MPAKRRVKDEIEDDELGSSATSSPSKKAKGKASKSAWSIEEEIRFLEFIDEVCRKELWGKAKNDELLKGRGANGIKSHWEALYKKLSK